MAGDIQAKYGTAAAFTQTNLDGIASSATWVAGWTSDLVNNTSALVLDYLVGATFQAESSGLSAGQIVMSAYSAFDTTPTWPALFSAGTAGTEGTATIHDTEVRDCAFAPVWSCITDTTASRIYPTPLRSIKAAFGLPDAPPPYWALFVAQSTGATLETTGDPNQVYRIPVLAQYT
jgi:hypothetical protein